MGEAFCSSIRYGCTCVGASYLWIEDVCSGSAMVLFTLCSVWSLDDASFTLLSISPFSRSLTRHGEKDLSSNQNNLYTSTSKQVQVVTFITNPH